MPTQPCARRADGMPASAGLAVRVSGIGQLTDQHRFVRANRRLETPPEHQHGMSLAACRWSPLRCRRSGLRCGSRWSLSWRRRSWQARLGPSPLHSRLPYRIAGEAERFCATRRGIRPESCRRERFALGPALQEHDSRKSEFWAISSDRTCERGAPVKAT